MAAVSNWGKMLELADPALKEDKEIVTTPLRNDWLAFQYVASRLNYEIALTTKATGTDLHYKDNKNVSVLNKKCVKKYKASEILEKNEFLVLYLNKKCDQHSKQIM